MGKPSKYIAVLFSLWIAAASLAGNLHVECETGNISVRTEMGSESVRLSILSPNRPVRPDDVTQIRERERFVIRCTPGDKERIDLELVVPYTTKLFARTKKGALSLEGVIQRAELENDRGDIRIATPWQIALFFARGSIAPKRTVVPKLPGMTFVEGFGVGDSVQFEGSVRKEWALAMCPEDRGLGRGELRFSPKQQGQSPVRQPDRLLQPISPLLREWYTELWVKGTRLGKLELVDIPLPSSSALLIPRQAKDTLGTLMPIPAPAAAASVPPPVARQDPAEGTFRSDVRLVTLPFPAHDEARRSIAGLTASDFEIEEDGVPQPVAFAGNEAQPFDLIILLDIGGRMVVPNLNLIRPAVRSFIGAAGPQDRVGLYALSSGLFQVLAPLTSDRDQVLRKLEEMPFHFHRSPLYDALTLSYAQENLHRSRRRTAIVVLTHGSDLQHWRPSEQAKQRLRTGRLLLDPGSAVSFESILGMASQLPVTVYPVVLPMINPLWTEEPSEGRMRMEQLAAATGGRMFTATKLEDLASVYGQVANELRALYAVGYYPRGEPNGKWRRVTVRVQKPGVIVPPRTTWYAW